MKLKDISSDARELIDELYHDEVALKTIVERVRHSFGLKITTANIYQVLESIYPEARKKAE